MQAVQAMQVVQAMHAIQAMQAMQALSSQSHKPHKPQSLITNEPQKLSHLLQLGCPCCGMMATSNKAQGT